MNGSTVYKINTKRYFAGSLGNLVNRGLTSIKLTESEIKGKSVLIKPNLCGPGFGEAIFHMTDPRLIVHLVNFCRENGAGSITVADHAAGYVDNPQRYFEDMGFNDLAQYHNFTFLNLAGHPFTEIGGLRLSEIALKSDVIIGTTLPKTHHQSTVSLGLKNLAMGVLDGRQAIHDEDRLNLAIANTIKELSKNRLLISIIDGRRGQEWLGPHLGDPVRPGFMLFGRDFSTVDMTGARLMGFDPRGITHINLAREGKPAFDEQGDEVEITRFRPSPNWGFIPTPEISSEIPDGWYVFWLNMDQESGIARFYTFNENKTDLRLSRNIDIRFNRFMSEEDAEDWAYDFDNIRELHSLNGNNFILNPAVTFRRENFSGLNRRFLSWRYDLGFLARDIECLAQKGPLRMSVTKEGLFYDGIIDDNGYMPQGQAPISRFISSQKLAAELLSRGVDRIDVARGTSYWEFIEAIQHGSGR